MTPAGHPNQYHNSRVCSSYACSRDDFGHWSVFLADKEDGSEAIPHDRHVTHPA